MRSGISLRGDLDGDGVRRLARQTKDAAQARRLLAIAVVYDGGSRTDAARLGNVKLQIVRDWVMRFNERGPDGLINGKAPGQKSRLTDQQRAALAQAIERGPAPYLMTAKAAELLGVSTRTAQLWVESGQLPSWKSLGWHRRIPRLAVLDLIENPVAAEPVIRAHAIIFAGEGRGDRWR